MAMSRAHPIISITGSSGAGTTSVKKTFENIFRREKVAAAYIEGDAFHRYNRFEMRTKMAEEAERGNKHFSHFSPETNLFEELERVFRDYGESGTGTTRHYVHDEQEAKQYRADPGTFTEWGPLPDSSDLLFYEGLHGAAVTDKVDIARHADLLIGVVPIINLEWIQKIHRDRAERFSSWSGNRLGEIEKFRVLGLTRVVRAEQFLRTDDVRASLGGVLDFRDCLVEVEARLGRTTHLDEPDGDLVSVRCHDNCDSNRASPTPSDAAREESNVGLLAPRPRQG